MFSHCGTCSSTISKRYDRNKCKITPRAYGSDKMIGFHCSVNFDDLLDTAASGEWETHLTSGKILLSPFFGSFELGQASSDVYEDGCGNQYPDAAVVPWTFTTPSTADDYSDEDWWYAFHEQFQYYTWGYFSCGGRIALNDAVIKDAKVQLALETPGAVPAIAPGFKFSMDTIPQFVELNGKGKMGQWRATGSFITPNVIRTIDIPGLSTLLNAQG